MGGGVGLALLRLGYWWLSTIGKMQNGSGTTLLKKVKTKALEMV